MRESQFCVFLVALHDPYQVSFPFMVTIPGKQMKEILLLPVSRLYGFSFDIDIGLSSFSILTECGTEISRG